MAKQKIYDIIPPGKREKTLLPRVKGNSKDVIDKNLDIRNGEEKSNPAFIFSKKAGFLIAVLIVFALGFYWFFSSAKLVKIELSPELNPLTFNARLSFSTSTDELDLSSSDLSQVVIPAVPVEIEETFNKQFFSSEVAIEEKAEGTIRVYNKHSRSISLVAGTRFLSSSEPTRQFHSKDKITISAGGYTDVSVIASEADKSYNIEACAFSIPGLRNYSPPELYYDVFGRSFSKMEGGRKDVTHKVTEQAISEAREQLLELSREEIRPILQNKVAPDYTILDNAIQINIIQAEPLDVEVGQEADTFVYQIRVKAVALKAKTSFLLEFAKSYIFSTLPANKEFIEDSLTFSFLPDEGRGERELSADLEFSTKVYYSIDRDSLKEIARGRSRGDISKYALEICPALLCPPKIEFSPFWARRASIRPEGVEIEINFE